MSTTKKNKQTSNKVRQADYSDQAPVDTECKE